MVNRDQYELIRRIPGGALQVIKKTPKVVAGAAVGAGTYLVANSKWQLGRVQHTPPTATDPRTWTIMPGKAKAPKSARGRAYEVPSAYVSRENLRHNQRFSKDGSLVFTGRDLLVDGTQAWTADGVWFAYPINPVFWTGTKVAAQARNYGQYRPLKLTLSYLPSVATTSSGDISLGVFSSSPGATTNSFLRTLLGTNGASVAQIWAQNRLNAKLGTLLTKNLYDVIGDLTEDTNPLWLVGFIAGHAGPKVPGKIMVDYAFRFSNPVTTAYQSSYLSNSLPAVRPTYCTIMSLGAKEATSDKVGYGPCTVIQVNWSGANPTYTIQGQECVTPTAYISYFHTWLSS